MRKLMAMVRGALASMGQFAWQLVKVGNELIWSLVRRPPTAEDSLDMADDVVDSAVNEDLAKVPTETKEVDQIRKLAAALDHGDLDYEIVAMMSDLQIDWLTAMPQEMRTKLRMASDAALSDHIRGKRSIPGLLRYEHSTVAEYRRSVLIQSRERDDNLVLTKAFG